MANQRPLPRPWAEPTGRIFAALDSQQTGLTSEEVLVRQRQQPRERAKRPPWVLAMLALLQQFKAPTVLILLAAAVISLFLQDSLDAGIILAIVVASGVLGFWQEHHATRAVQALISLVKVQVNVLRDGQLGRVPIDQIVVGDVVRLSAGGMIAGDCVVLEAKDLFVDEAALTGETFPVEKHETTSDPAATLAQRRNMLFEGTHVTSGTGLAVVVATGSLTELGKITQHLAKTPPLTEFERGVRQFGFFLLEITLMLVLSIFAINVFLHRPVLDSFLFALALAVGLTPQLLPAIISVNLAHGARAMAAQKVIVKRLAAIENFGSMDVLCTDKTGTLTQGTVRLHSAVDAMGLPSQQVLAYAYLNALHQSGFDNPIDEALRHAWPPQEPIAAGGIVPEEFGKIDEVPYDFVRKRLSLLLSHGQGHVLVTKGAVPGVLALCSHCRQSDGQLELMAGQEDALLAQFNVYGEQGWRVLAIATRDLGAQATIERSDEKDLVFQGFLLLADPPKADAAATIARLRELGVNLKVITGDSAQVARSLCVQVGIAAPRLLTGSALDALSDAALQQQASHTDVFAEIAPNEKERIIIALRKAGHVVGYMGDGINDACALHAADVSLSVDSAVDVAKEAADIVLLEKDLGVLIAGVIQGRRTFANTLKYIFMATSANFGNMFSMAGASLFLPFLPLLPKQILLTNALTDFPEMTIASDTVSDDQLARPGRWSVAFIRKFMLTFGLLSSVFDYLTFAVLRLGLRANAEEFRTGWFVESVISASAIVLVIRTRRPFFTNRPSTLLTTATGVIAVVTLALPYSPLAQPLGFVPLPPIFLGALVALVVTYLASAEVLKWLFYRSDRRKPTQAPL